MDGAADRFVIQVDRLLSSPEAGRLLGELAKNARTPFESNFAAGFAYRVQAVAPGIAPALKAQLYEKAADAFSRAAEDATPALHASNCG